MGIILNLQVSYSIQITSELSGLYPFYCLLIVMYECFTDEFIVHSLYTNIYTSADVLAVSIIFTSFSRKDVKTSAE